MIAKIIPSMENSIILRFFSYCSLSGLFSSFIFLYLKSITIIVTSCRMYNSNILEEWVNKGSCHFSSTIEIKIW